MPSAIQGEFLENQINEMDYGFSCFDTNDGDAPTSARLDVVIPFKQNMRSDLAPSFTPCDTNIYCPSIPNNSLAVSCDVSNSGSFSGGGKVVSTRQRRVVRTVSDFAISNESSGAAVKCTSEVNALDRLPRKSRMVFGKEKDGLLIMAEAGV